MNYCLPLVVTIKAEAQQTEQNSVKPYEIDEIMSAMKKADPHMMEFSKISIFDIISAKDTMSDNEILIINDFVEMHNQYIVDIKTDPDSYHEYDAELKEKFVELEEEVQESVSVEVNYMRLGHN